MAGMVPGVQHWRRRSCTKHTPPNHGHPSCRPWLEPSSQMATSTAVPMDEAALRARLRLENKLGYFHASRFNKVVEKEVKGKTKIMGTTEGHEHLIAKITGKSPWPFWVKSASKSKGHICVVCLEDLRSEEQQIMELFCSHKYHSKCLLPWLSVHQNCPSCRSPVQS